ncbi:MAG: hypothetical protein C0425_11490 [Chlorobiaceae bacterium]|nr:hypothetical protein [Chlorobiaceae bacterium]MBA4310938.1 hypothetical protein [Chlorobiaceae bacterium]
MDNTEFSKLKRNLTALVEFSSVVNSSLDLTFTLNNLLFSTMGKFLTPKGMIILKPKDKYEIISMKGLDANLTKDFPNITEENELDTNTHLHEFLSRNNLTLKEKIFSSSRCLGIIALGEKINKNSYSEDEVQFLKTILNIAATAIENSLFIDELKKVNRDLDSRINRLNSLFELGKEFGLLTEEGRISKLLIYSLLGQFLVSSYAVIIVEGEKLRVIESTVSKNKLLDSLKQYDLSNLSTHLNKIEIEKNYEKISNFNFELIVPMQLRGVTKGLLLLGSRINKLSYTRPDIEFINSVGSLAIISLENKRLFKEALEKQKMEEELELAKEIQKNLLPKSMPQLSDFEFDASTISSRQIGGDYYDLIKIDDENYIGAIADVSGKGVPASLLMANLQAFLKSISRLDLSIEQATELINDLVSENTSDGRFITFFWFKLDIESKMFTYVNAGHNPPLLIRDNKIRYLDKGGILLGVMKTKFHYVSETITLKKNDLIVLFTDGVTEAKNKNDEEFSDEKLEKILLSLTHNTATEVINEIKNSIEVFTNGQPQSDDITLLVMKVF